MALELKKVYIFDVHDHNIPDDIRKAAFFLGKERNLYNNSYFYLDEDITYEDPDNPDNKVDPEYYGIEITEKTLKVHNFLKENGYNSEEVVFLYWW